MRKAAMAAMALALGTAPIAQSDRAVVGQAPDDVPALRPAVARAEAGMNAMQAALMTRLGDEMASGGAASAVTVCRDEAATIAARVAREQGIALGRTSHRLRNPGNAPPPWAAALIRTSAGSKAGAQSVRVFDLGDRVGVVRPIGFAPMCATCHGSPDQIPAPVRAIVAAAYPDDAATAFVPGDLRGWMWAEVTKP